MCGARDLEDGDFEVASRGGVEVRRQTATDGVVAEAAQLYEAGMPVIRIAEQLSVSGSALRRSMLKAGVEMRPRGGYRPAPLAG